jgi:hypothetical protein
MAGNACLKSRTASPMDSDLFHKLFINEEKRSKYNSCCCCLCTMPRYACTVAVKRRARVFPTQHSFNNTRNQKQGGIIPCKGINEQTHTHTSCQVSRHSNPVFLNTHSEPSDYGGCLHQTTAEYPHPPLNNTKETKEISTR